MGQPSRFSIQKLAILGIAATLPILLAPTAPAAFALSLLSTTVGAIFVVPPLGRVPSHVWAPAFTALVGIGVPGALELEGLSSLQLTRGDWVHVLVTNLPIPGLILSLAYLSISLDVSGFFNWCSLRILRRSHGNGRLLLVNLFLGVSAITFVTSNDIVILSMTPILVHLGRNAKLQNLTPYLMAQYIAANTASVGLYIGNPTNIVIGSSANLGFVEYAARMALPTVVATVTALGLVAALFNVISRRNRTVATFRLPNEVRLTTWTRHMTLKVAIFGLALVVLSVAGDPTLVERSWMPADASVTDVLLCVSFLFAMAAFVIDVLRDLREDAALVAPGVRTRVRRIPFEIVPFFLSFCVLLVLIERAGVIRLAQQLVMRAFDHGPILGGVVTGLGGVFVVNVMNNIPATLLFRELWSDPTVVAALGGPEGVNSRIFVDCSLFASNFGANLSFIGALAGIMWLRITRDLVRETGAEMKVPSARDFLTYGIVLVPIVTLVTCYFIAWLSVLA